MKTSKQSKKSAPRSTTGGAETPTKPTVVDRATFQAELDALRVREKVHTHGVTRLRQLAGGCPWWS